MKSKTACHVEPVECAKHPSTLNRLPSPRGERGNASESRRTGGEGWIAWIICRSLPLVAALLGTLLGSPARCESLWDRRDHRSAFLFVDTRARRVGDVLTVVVREATDIDNKEKRALNKSSESRGSFLTKGNSSGTVLSTRSLAADFNATGDSGRKFDGNAEFSSQRELVDRMTVTVMDVLPNGNLVIEGTRRRLISGDERLLRVSGIVRPIDIGAGNVVESQFISNFQVAYEGKGVETKFTNQGWMSRFVNYVWPF